MVAEVLVITSFGEPLQRNQTSITGISIKLGNLSSLQAGPAQPSPTTPELGLRLLSKDRQTRCRLLPKRLQTSGFVGFESKPTGWRLRYVCKSGGNNKAFSTSFFGGKHSWEGTSRIDTASLDLQEKPRERCDALGGAPGFSSCCREPGWRSRLHFGQLALCRAISAARCSHMLRSHWHRCGALCHLLALLLLVPSGPPISPSLSIKFCPCPHPH